MRAYQDYNLIWFWFDFAKFARSPILENICEQFLLSRVYWKRIPEGVVYWQNNCMYSFGKNKWIHHLLVKYIASMTIQCFIKFTSLCLCMSSVSFNCLIVCNESKPCLRYQLIFDQYVSGKICFQYRHDFLHLSSIICLWNIS